MAEREILEKATDCIQKLGEGTPVEIIALIIVGAIDELPEGSAKSFLKDVKDLISRAGEIFEKGVEEGIQKGNFEDFAVHNGSEDLGGKCLLALARVKEKLIRFKNDSRTGEIPEKFVMFYVWVIGHLMKKVISLRAKATLEKISRESLESFFDLLEKDS